MCVQVFSGFAFCRLTSVDSIDRKGVSNNLNCAIHLLELVLSSAPHKFAYEGLLAGVRKMHEEYGLL